jgi:hypothetical protein
MDEYLHHLGDKPGTDTGNQEGICDQIEQPIHKIPLSSAALGQVLFILP